MEVSVPCHKDVNSSVLSGMQGDCTVEAGQIDEKTGKLYQYLKNQTLTLKQEEPEQQAPPISF
jgi:hypothetical protein